MEKKFSLLASSPLIPHKIITLKLVVFSEMGQKAWSVLEAEVKAPFLTHTEDWAPYAAI